MRYKRTIGELIEHRAEVTPDFIFGIHEDDDRQISFGELEVCVNRLANGLAKLGVVQGQRVAVMLGNHPDHIFTFFALAKLGVIWVPVNVNLRGPSLDFLIEQTTPSAIIVDSKFWDRLAPCLSKRTIERIIIRNPVISLKSMNAVDFAEVAQRPALHSR